MKWFYRNVNRVIIWRDTIIVWKMCVLVKTGGQSMEEIRVFVRFMLAILVMSAIQDSI